MKLHRLTCPLTIDIIVPFVNHPGNPSKFEKFVPGLSNAKRELERGGDTRGGRATAVLRVFEICCGSSETYSV